MSTVTVTLDSKIYDRKAVKRALTNAVGKSAKVFKEATRRRMVRSIPAGRIYDVGRTQGLGFNRRFRRSAYGQRPAVDTTNLINAIRDKRQNPNVVIVDIAPKPNRRNGALASDYAERLQRDMGRRIMTKLDARIAEIEMTFRIDKSVKKLV